MPEADDLSLLIEAARASGDIARRFFEAGNAQSWDKADNLGPVTEADLAVNDHLRSHLRGARPGYGWLSEECEDAPERLASEHLFIIDPIDGTRSFIEGGKSWSHSLAIAKQGRIVAAVVYLPMKNRLFSAALGQGAALNGTPIKAAARSELAGASVVAAKPIYSPQNWRDAIPDVKKVYRPSLAYRLSLVAEGRYDAMITLRPSFEWDIAAGSLILSEAGARATTRTGQALTFNNPVPTVEGVVAANPVLHAQIIDALAHPFRMP